jgi:hypothetical protein
LVFCFETFKKKPKSTGGGGKIGRKWSPGFKKILLTPMGVIIIVWGLLTHADGGHIASSHLQ